MAMANWMVACTMSTDRMLGSTCSSVMRKLPLPQARDAKMYSRDHTALADARVTRANVGMLKMPMAMMELTMPALIELANDDRAGINLAPLKINPVLVLAAELKAQDMALKNYFAHTSPEGLSPWYWFDKAGYNFAYAGENLAIDFSESANVNAAWMNSPGHRANILNKNFTEIGIATAKGYYQGRETIFVVQLFESRL